MESSIMNLIYSLASDAVCSRISGSESSTSNSNSDEDLSLITHKNKRRKITDFVGSVALKYSPDVFREHFRLARSTVQSLKEKFESSWISSTPRRPKSDFTKAILLTLWTLGNQESLRGISDRSGVSISTSYTTLTGVCKLLYQNQKEYIVWPTDGAINNTINGFKNLGDFPNVIGCVDGSHIQIPGPANDNSYYNRKGFHSVILQAICDSTLKFIDVYVGWPGSVHDAKVLKSSPIYNKLKQTSAPTQDYNILGDSAYPIDVFLMTPFKDSGHLSAKEKRFNQKLSAVRVSIERAFGRLKGMFRRLKYLHCYKLSIPKFFIVAACILHNISIDKGDAYYEEEYDDDEIPTPDFSPINADENISFVAVDKRNAIPNILFSN